MARLNMVIADSDGMHMNRLVNYLTENNKQLSISSFSDRQSLIRYLREDNSHIHILLFSEDMYTEEIEKKRIDLKMILSDNSFAGDSKYKPINKYQRADDFANEILIEYSDVTGNINAISAEGKDSTRAIAMYSPVGGSGKTTLAIVVAKALSTAGRKVLYLNFEGVSSVKSVFSGMGAHTMSEVFLAAKTKKANVGLKVVQCHETHYETNIDFINAPECAAEYSEMTPKELRRIVREVKAVGQYDDIILDMNSGYNDDIFELLDECNLILMPYLSNQTSMNKMEVFADEIDKLEKLETVARKAIIIENCSRIINREGFGALSVKMAVSETAVLKNIDNILYSDSSGVESQLLSLLL